MHRVEYNQLRSSEGALAGMGFGAEWISEARGIF